MYFMLIPTHLYTKTGKHEEEEEQDESAQQQIPPALHQFPYHTTKRRHNTDGMEWSDDSNG